MRKTLLVMGHEIATTFRRKSFLFFGLGIPLVLGIVLLIVSIVNRDQTQTDEEPLERSEETGIQGYVDESGVVTMEPPGIKPGSLRRFDSLAQANEALDQAEIDGYFIVPSDYVASGQVSYVADEYNPLSDDLNERGLEWTLLANLLGDVELATAVAQPLSTEVLRLERPGGIIQPEDSSFVRQLPITMVVLLYMLIMVPASALVNAVTDEKKNRVMETVLLSVSPRQFITGKILALGVVGLVLIVAWMSVVWMAIRFGGRTLTIPDGFTLPNHLLVWVLIYGALGYAMYGVLMAGLGALIPDVKDSRGASMVLMSPLFLAYLGTLILVRANNEVPALILSMFPLTAPVSMIGRMALAEVPVWQSVLSAVLQALTAVGLTLLAARLFHARFLLSGQPFKLRAYFAALMGR
jgi:ABC-2 type transport system permease protein